MYVNGEEADSGEVANEEDQDGSAQRVSRAFAGGMAGLLLPLGLIVWTS